MTCYKCGEPTMGDDWICDDCKFDRDMSDNDSLGDDECEDCGGLNGDHKISCDEYRKYFPEIDY